MKLNLSSEITEKIQEMAKRVETTPERVCEVILEKFFSHRGSLIPGRREVVIEWPPREKYTIFPKIEVQ